MKNLYWIKYALIVFIIAFVSCRKTSKSKLDSQLENEAMQKELKVELLVKKYNAISSWDTLPPYTQIISENIIGEQRKIRFKGEIYDIIHRDSIYIIKLFNRFDYLFIYHQYIAKVGVTKKQFETIKESLYDDISMSKANFIIEVKKVVKYSPIQKTESDFDGESIYTVTDYEFENSIIEFEGILIDFIL